MQPGVKFSRRSRRIPDQAQSPSWDPVPLFGDTAPKVGRSLTLKLRSSNRWKFIN